MWTLYSWEFLSYNINFLCQNSQHHYLRGSQKLFTGPGKIRDVKQDKMKQGIHPEKYKFVVFKDMTNGTEFIGKSTASGSSEKVKWEDGNEYPVVKLDISSTSHPFYTGKNVMIDTAGRIDKFKKRYGKK